MGKFEVLDHPLIQHKLTLIRDKKIGTKIFRETVNEISTLMAYEVSRDMPLEDVTVETPMATTVKKNNWLAKKSGNHSYSTSWTRNG